jgi:hypothetical protein
VRGCSTRIVEAQLALDLCVWFRTASSPVQPRRGWLRTGHTEIEISVQPDTNEGYATLALDHSLFAARSPELDDNGELHRLDAPLLEQALRRWQARIGARSVELSGALVGVRDHGFSSDPDDYF